MTSPYTDVLPGDWSKTTDELVEHFPLEMDELVQIVMLSWQGVFVSKIGTKRFQIGKHTFPKPQIIAFFLHELIPLELASQYPGVWLGEETAADKDIVYIPDHSYSIEIKTSSHSSQIFGNRSYAQKGAKSKKTKSGYYLAVNFDKSVQGSPAPKLRKIRFGWLDHSDWQGQIAATGQQARLSPEVERSKLRLLFEDR